MNRILLYTFFLAGTLLFCSSGCDKEPPTDTESGTVTASLESISTSFEALETEITVSSDCDWGIYAEDRSWCALSLSGGTEGVTTVKVRISENTTAAVRENRITLRYASGELVIPVRQDFKPLPPQEFQAPEGYRLVWQDEFDEGDVPDAKKWRHEVKGSGWVNHELQNYVSGKSPKGQRVTEIKDGALEIHCFKEDGKIYSGRIYGNVNQGWKYCYVEAGINLPSGKGTWPAFWMMPVHFASWPADGEIDIMEEVGYHPNYVSSSLHATGHVHSNGTQVTREVYCKGAEGEFHTYAMEWTPEYFQFYVDGKKSLYYKNPGTGKVDWPYDAPFYVILNLAWGGDWGGSQGVNEAALPVTMKVDYVRVFQKI